MRPRFVVLLLASIAVLLALLAWGLTSERDSRRVPDVALATEALVPSFETLDAPAPARTLEDSVERSTRLEAAPMATAATTTDQSHAATCIIFGRVVDQSNQPLEGVVVRLQAVGAWADDFDAPALPSSPNLHGFELATGSDGTFRFDVVPPADQITFLTLEPDPFHDWAQVFFSSTRGGSKPPLIAGAHDLGVIRLVLTGAIRGRVSDASGHPVSGANPRVADSRGAPLVVSAVDGSYTIAHVKGDAVRVRVWCQGYLSRTGEPIQITPGRFTDDVDFVLESAPTLSGVVVDELGAPLKRVELRGMPVASGEGAQAWSSADGSFTVYLPQAEPYTLQATLDGFDPSPERSQLTLHLPGTRDLRIEMKRAVKLPMRVVDEQTENSIERFGTVVLPDTSQYLMRRVNMSEEPHDMVDHPDGRVEVAWRPGVDTLVVVAPGYVRRVVDLTPTELVSGTIVVRLQRGVTILGRVLRSKAPESEVDVRLEPGIFAWRDDRADVSASLANFRVDIRRIQRARTDTDGRFRFSGLERGPYRVIASAGGDRIHACGPFAVAAHEEKDLGDLELDSTSTILGSVLVPPGRSASGLTIRLDDWNAAEKEITDDDGRFRFTGLAPGVHQLFLEAVSGRIADPPPLAVRVRAGETMHVVYDVRDRGTCAVDLTILIASRPAVNREVTLVLPGTPERNARLGRTDARGRVTGWARAGVEAAVELQTDAWSLIRHPTARIGLELDGRVETTVNFDFGELVLEVPSQVAIPEDGRAVLTVLRNGADAKVVEQLLLPIDAKSEQRTDAFLERAARKLHFATVFVGEFTFRLQISDSSPSSGSSPTSATGAGNEQPALVWTTSAVIESGKRTEVSLH